MRASMLAGCVVISNVKMNVNRLRVKPLNTYYIYCYNRYYSQQSTDFPNCFNPKEAEPAWYNVWEKNKYFQSQNIDKEPFKMILPPPNVTGVLHLGHALTVTIQDVLARWHRMNGNPVVWVPGFDHAGIATQAILERHLLKKGILRANLDEKEFNSLLWQWKQEKEDDIIGQLKALGATLDWPRQYFTLDKHHNTATTEAFVTLSERNLIYRDKKIINWCPFLKSTLSDIEVEFLEVKERTNIDVPGYDRKISFGLIYELAYQLENSNEKIHVATTRPETVFGDTAIAVHPENNLYNRYIGQRVWHPLRETFIPIIADSSVKLDFGTGAVKVTPAHDEADFKLAKKHKLDIISIIDEGGHISVANKEFQGMPRFIARHKIVKMFQETGILQNVKEHQMLLPRCSRTNDIIEYQIKEQWFVNCRNMAKRAIHAVENGSLKIDPAFHEQVWFDWLENIRDWCVSRQLWWGHKIPAYYATIDGKTKWFVSRSREEALSIAQTYKSDVKLHQDNDVLDTWFSSALLPFSVMGWPNKTEDFKTYYPLSLMETGSDILFFWVARMVMLGLELTDGLPFKEILLHGVLCDDSGKKMSKSRGNVILPEYIINGISLADLNAHAEKSYELGTLSKQELQRTILMNGNTFPNGIPECGADALRMTLCSHKIKSRTVTFNAVECAANKRFCHKIWQASRYVILSIENNENVTSEKLTMLDEWILSRMCLMIHTVNEAFAEYSFYKAVAALKQFFYYEFCDFYLEGTKFGFQSDDTSAIHGHSYTLLKCLEVFLRTLYPVAPYIADDLYSKLQQYLPGFSPTISLLETAYPLPQDFTEFRNVELEKKMNNVLILIDIVRNLMANVSKKSNPALHIVTNNMTDHALYTKCINLIKGGTRIYDSTVHPAESYLRHEHSIEVTCEEDNRNCTLYIVIPDGKLCEQIKSGISKKRMALETKLNALVKLNNSSSESSNHQQIEREKQVTLLKKKMERLSAIR